MLTPAFELSQDKIFVIFTIRAPHAKINDTEIFVEDDEFKFFSKPYFLRLNLPGQIVEDGRESADYNSEKGKFTIKIPKKTTGEVFEGLELITKLLTPKSQRAVNQPLLEVIGSNIDYLPSEILEGEELEWYIDQTPYQEPLEITSNLFTYGFAGQKSQVFSRLQEDLLYVIDIRNPDSLPNTERQKLCQQQETDKFDSDYYLADLFDDDIVPNLLNFEPKWTTLAKQLPSDSKNVESDNDKPKDIAQNERRNFSTTDHPTSDLNKGSLNFTEEEQEKLRNLPKKEYLLEETVLPSVYIGLVDIIYAYCYNHRITEGENNVESGWNICKLSSTLSWFVSHSNLKDLLVTNFRRSLCFSLYRNWKLSQKVLQDVQEIFQLGVKQILKCLLEIHAMFIDCDSRYILNDFYITDYCVWIQSASRKQIKSVAVALAELNITKADVDLNLEEIESAAQLVMDEELLDEMNKLTVDSDDDNENDDDDDDDDDESDDDSVDDSDNVDDSDSVDDSVDDSDGESDDNSVADEDDDDDDDESEDSDSKLEDDTKSVKEMTITNNNCDNIHITNSSHVTNDDRSCSTC